MDRTTSFRVVVFVLENDLKNHQFVDVVEDNAIDRYDALCNNSHCFFKRTRNTNKTYKCNNFIPFQDHYFRFVRILCRHWPRRCIYGITFSFFPTSIKALTHLWISSSVWAAEIWTRMRALPCGTTGKLKPIT